MLEAVRKERENARGCQKGTKNSQRLSSENEKLSEGVSGGGREREKVIRREQ